MKAKVKNVKNYSKFIDEKIVTPLELEKWYNEEQSVFKIKNEDEIKLDKDGYFEPNEEYVKELFEIYLEYKTVKNIFNLSVQVLRNHYYGFKKDLELDDDNFENFRNVLMATVKTVHEVQEIEKAEKQTKQLKKILEILKGAVEND